VAFVMLAWIEFLVAGDLVRHWPLVLAYATLPAVTCATIVLHYLTRGFRGEAWFWWMNAGVSAALAVALFAARHAAAEIREDDIPAETRARPGAHPRFGYACRCLGPRLILLRNTWFQQLSVRPRCGGRWIGIEDQRQGSVRVQTAQISHCLRGGQ
jgi:hypothetical protein